jgi:RimJ/RimL family protein N-acetyltransferase
VPDNSRPVSQLPKIELAVLSARVLEALTAGSIDRASEAFGRTLPAYFLDHSWLWAYRLAQVKEDPTSNRWLVRAVIDASHGEIVGHAGFHGPPDEHGMVEIGYTIAEPFRRRGFARATAAALIAYAAVDPAVTTVRASIRPDNEASLATIRPFGFIQVGEQIDDVDGLEYIYEVSVRE